MRVCAVMANITGGLMSSNSLADFTQTKLTVIKQHLIFIWLWFICLFIHFFAVWLLHLAPVLPAVFSETGCGPAVSAAADDGGCRILLYFASFWTPSYSRKLRPVQLRRSRRPPTRTQETPLKRSRHASWITPTSQPCLVLTQHWWDLVWKRIRI